MEITDELFEKLRELAILNYGKKLDSKYRDLQAWKHYTPTSMPSSIAKNAHIQKLEAELKEAFNFQ